MLIQLSNGCKCFAQILPIKGKPTIVIDGVSLKHWSLIMSLSVSTLIRSLRLLGFSP